MRFKIHADTSVCVGAGMCVLQDDEVFDQRDRDGIVQLLIDEPSEEHLAAVEEAVRKCPSRAISIERLDKPDAE